MEISFCEVLAFFSLPRRKLPPGDTPGGRIDFGIAMTTSDDGALEARKLGHAG
jgi:hypothetical protein